MTEFDEICCPADDPCSDHLDPWATTGYYGAASALWWDRTAHVACGRCGGSQADYDADPMFHLRWECLAQDAWIESALNDRKARPDRARQARRDLKLRQIAAADGGIPRQ